MSIVTFWNNGKEQTGKTLAMTAVATYMAIEHNYKILIISTSYNDKTLKNCFWAENKVKRNLGLFGPNTNAVLENGIDGLAKIIHSNKVTPQIITNYTKIVFKDKLEILLGTDNIEFYNSVQENYAEIIKLADKHYDLVLVDLDAEIQEKHKQEILNESNLIVATMSQRLKSIKGFNEFRKKNPAFNSNKVLLLIGRYDKFSKYTIKNITRNYLEEKVEVCTLPYNTLYFEAAEEAKVPDLFFRIRNVKDDDDRNYFFIQEVKRLSERIIYRLQDLQMRMGR